MSSAVIRVAIAVPSGSNPRGGTATTVAAGPVPRASSAVSAMNRCRTWIEEAAPSSGPPAVSAASVTTARVVEDPAGTVTTGDGVSVGRSVTGQAQLDTIPRSPGRPVAVATIVWSPALTGSSQ